MNTAPKLSQKMIEAARSRLRGVAKCTPLDYSQTFSDLADLPIHLKLENLQKTGSFKLRGAYNKIALLADEEKRCGVIAASAGNHAQGVAYAAREQNISCTIVMPETASLAKVAATTRYGANVVLHGPTYDDAYAYARELQAKEGLTYVHAFDDEDVIAGQGTIGLEILEQLKDVSAVVAPMGGGGLVCGLAVALKTVNPSIRVIGVEAAAAACFHTSLAHGGIQTIQTAATIADGIAVRRPGDITYQLATKYVDDVILVEEEEISRTMVLLMERAKLVSEGAGAAALAAVIYKKVHVPKSPVAVVISGGNVDVTVLSRIIEHGLVESGRYLRLSITLADTPGSLRQLLDVIANSRANVLSIQHHRLGTKIHFGETEVEIDLETRDHRHIEAIMAALEGNGYRPNVIG